MLTALYFVVNYKYQITGSTKNNITPLLKMT